MARGPWLRLNTLKYWALLFIIRRALSSERGFFGFLDLGFGCVGLPSLRVNGSGWIEECMGILGFVVGSFERGNEG